MIDSSRVLIDTLIRIDTLKIIDTLIVPNNNSFWEEIIPNWVTAIATLVGVLALFKAYRQFIKQKWWEKRAEFYTEIITHIYNTKLYAEKYYEYDYNEIKLSDDEVNEINKIIDDSKAKIDMYIDTGTFIVSKKVSDRLKQFRKELNSAPRTHDLHEYLGNELKASDNCIKDIIKFAQKDLKVKSK